MSVFTYPGFCAQNNVSGTEDMLIGSAFKVLAKIFVSAQDKDKLIARIDKMSEQKFQRRYAWAYKVARNSPVICGRLGFTEHMSKQSVIDKIKLMDRDAMLAAIDSVSDADVAEQLKLYMLEKNQELQKSNIAQQVSGIWHKFIN